MEDKKTVDDVTASILAQILSARAQAVTAMALLTANGKEYCDAYSAAQNLDSDMQRMLHGSFEA